VLAEVAQPVEPDELARRLRDQHLAAVADRRDPRRAVDVEPHITLVGDDRLAGVEAHPHADRPLLERSLPLTRGIERIRGASERDKERVALRVDLDAVVPLECLAQRAAVRGEGLGVVVAELVQQPSRAFDVGEEKGDRAGGEGAHPRMMTRSRLLLRASNLLAGCIQADERGHSHVHRQSPQRVTRGDR
jgi:hypothetical protein